MTEKTIELRGHHLIPLTSKYLEKECKDNLDNLMGFGAGAEIANMAFEQKANEYSFDFANHSNNVYSVLLGNPEQKVKITGDYDEVCSRCPPKKKNECLNTPDSDWIVANDFGMRLDNIYEMKEVMQRIELFGRTVMRKYVQKAMEAE